MIYVKTLSLDQAADICLEMFELYTEPYAYALMSGELPAITYLVHRTASKDRDWTATIRLKNSLTISIFRCEIYIADILYLCRRCKMYLQTPEVFRMAALFYMLHALLQTQHMDFSTNTDIDLPEGTIVALVPDGLLGGEALALRIPTGAFEKAYERGDTIPSEVELGMIEGLSSAVMTRLDPMLGNLDSIIAVLKNNLTDEQLKKLMDNANGTLANARGITAKFDNMMACEVPMLMDSIRLVMTDVHQITSDIREADLKATILKLDTTVNGVNQFMQTVNSTEGTIGMLLNDRDLYINLTNTVTSADSLLTDLKAHPKRYVHFSLFGKKDK